MNDYSQKLNKMIPKNTKKVILFLLRSTDGLGSNINSIARDNSISVGSAFKVLKDLETDGILKKREIGNQSNYTLDLVNEETIKLCELILLEERRQLKGHAKLYADDIDAFKESDLILLFGSILKGRAFNDVDVLFVTNSVKKARDFCLGISKVRTKPVVPLILKREDLIRALKEKQQAITGIMTHSVVLRGASAFIEVMKHAQDQA